MISVGLPHNPNKLAYYIADTIYNNILQFHKFTELPRFYTFDSKELEK